MSEAADELWATMVTVVMDSRGDWRRRASEAAGMPFSRVRVLRRLEQGAMCLRDIAESTAMDPPAATVAINDLEARGLVTREVSTGNRRMKDVSLTEAGREIARRIDRLRDVAPPALLALDDQELALLKSVVDNLVVSATPRTSSHRIVSDRT